MIKLFACDWAFRLSLIIWLGWGSKAAYWFCHVVVWGNVVLSITFYVLLSRALKLTLGVVRGGGSQFLTSQPNFSLSANKWAWENANLFVAEVLVVSVAFISRGSYWTTAGYIASWLFMMSAVTLCRELNDVLGSARVATMKKQEVDAA